MPALFKNSKGDLAEAVLVGNEWQIVTRKKESVRVHRRKTTDKNGEEFGKTIQEVLTIEAQLSNDEFKAQFFPANYAAIDLMDKTPAPKELPKPQKVIKQSTQKVSTER